MLIQPTPALLKVWDLSKGEWSSGTIPYRNTLFQALHGEFVSNSFVIDGSAYVDDRITDGDNSDLAEALANNLPPGSVLDGASGSRKSAQFLGWQGEEAPSTWYLPEAKRISHYSILWSECREMHRLTDISIRVMDDELEANIQRYGIGDCHGIISYSLYMSLRYQQPTAERILAPLQFRAGVPCSWVAKGTLLPLPDELLQGADIIFAKSSFKGNAPTIGRKLSIPLLFLGVYQYAQRKRYKTSHSVVGWFSSKDSRQFLLDSQRVELEKLVALRGNVPAVLKRFIESQSEVDEDGNEVSFDLDNPSPKLEEYWRYALVLNADKYGQLSQHPKTAQFIGKLMRQMYFDAASGKFIKASGLMAAPLPALKPGFVISHDLKPGQHIFWRYPVRHYGDIRLVTVINPKLSTQEEILAAFNTRPKSSYELHCLMQSIQGCAWINPTWFLEVGGDHDGDYLCLLPADKVQPLADEIPTWESIPEIEKPAKKPLALSLEEIAAKATGNQVGLLAWAMYSCRTLGWKKHYSKLGQQIQLEVDSFKADTGVDHPYINTLMKALDKRLPNSAWTKWYKEDSLFLTQASNRCPMGDTLSLLLNQASDVWQQGIGEQGFSPWETRPYWSYQAMFDSIPVPGAWLAKAQSYYRDYAKEMASAVKADKATRMTRIGAVLDKWNAFADGLRERLSAEQMKLTAIAFHKAWHARHHDDARWTASAVFNMFHREYVELLSTAPQLAQFRCWKDLSRQWDDVLVVTVVVQGGKHFLRDKTGAVQLRIMEDRYFPPAGLTFPARIKSNVNLQGQVSFLTVSLGEEEELDF